MSHVFVTQGDLRRIWCDAWLMPTGPAVFIVPYWFTPEAIDGLGERLQPAPFNHRHITDPVPESYLKGDSRTFRLLDCPGAEIGPQPWLTNVGGGQRSDPVTHHMLFIGFGLADDNFHRILDDVRKVLGDPTEADGAVGTVLTLVPEPLRDELWDDEMRIVPMAAQGEDPIAEAARHLEIFLDYVVFLTGQRPQYLLNATYDGLLTDPERHFRDELLRMQNRFGRSLVGTPLGEEFRRFVLRLGGRED